MIHVAILTVALVSGECPECDRGQWGVISAPAGEGYAAPNAPGYPQDGSPPMAPALVPPPPLIKHPSVLQVIPCPVVRCVGQDCFSITRPYLPGVPVYDYRKDFNYPWSQAPYRDYPISYGAGPGYGMPVPPYDMPAPGAEMIDGPEVLPGPLLQEQSRSGAQRRDSSRRTTSASKYRTVRASAQRTTVDPRAVRR